MTTHPHSLLASYATFKELYNSKKYTSPYQILAEFIMYVVVTKRIYSFSAARIQEELKTEFGFTQPHAVIQTAMKRLPGIRRVNGEYTVILNELKTNPDFEKYKTAAETGNNNLIESLFAFSQTGETGKTIEKEKLSQEFVSFLLDDEGDQECRKIIGAFIIANETNDRIKQQMVEIREGSILFSGLSYNISEYGSLREHLTLFLDTEILFDIAGLNGGVFQTLAMDFLQLVTIANQKEKTISLYFFPEIKKEIDRFFARAEQVMNGKGEPIQRPAMQSIIYGCSEASDVKDKLTDFYRMLQQKYGIKQYDKENYYTRQDIPYELEAEEIDGLSQDESYEGKRYCSNINKLRKGDETPDYLKSKYLFITNTTLVLNISKCLIERRRTAFPHDRCCDYAISLSHITNLLWYKLNRGFGEQKFPQNIDVVIKARVLLSGYITQNISTTYQEVKEQYAAGKLSRETAASRIIALREKVSLPEEITADNLEDSLCFSNDYLNLLAEKDAKKERLLEEQNNIIEALKQKIQERERKDAAFEQDKINKKHRIRLAIKIVSVISFSLIILFICFYYKNEGLGIAASIVTLITFFWKEIKGFLAKTIAEYRNSIKKQ